MRDIKFRVWDNVDYMSSPFTLQDIQSKKIAFTSDCPVMQYTGLKDKNGKEIYEGDVVQDTLYGSDAVASIVFRNGIIGVDYAKRGFYTTYERLGYGIKVIGNIYETPNLLNQ